MRYINEKALKIGSEVWRIRMTGIVRGRASLGCDIVPLGCRPFRRNYINAFGA
jgi:hypothetical protein